MLKDIITRIFRPKPIPPNLREGKYACVFERWHAFRGTAWEDKLLETLMEDFPEVDPKTRQIYILAYDALHNSDDQAERECFTDWIADIFREWNVEEEFNERINQWEGVYRREAPCHVRDRIREEVEEEYTLKYERKTTHGTNA